MTREFRQLPRCPYCGDDDHDWWDGLNIPVNDGSAWLRSCSSCGEDYTVVACVDVTFATDKP